MCKTRPFASATGGAPFSAIWILASIVILFSPVGAASEKSQDRLTVHVGDPIVVTRQPSRVWKDNRWLWFPQISRFSTGELMVGFWMSNEERYPEGSDFGGYSISRDRGRTWGWRRLRTSPAWNRHAFEDGSLIEPSWLTVPVEPGITGMPDDPLPRI